MKFFSHHAGLFAVAFVLSFIFYAIAARLSRMTAVASLGKTRIIQYPALIVIVGFLLWGYFGRVIYYFPNNIGVIGDNYLFLGHALRRANYFAPQHMAFPWLGEQFISLVAKLRLFYFGDPFYLEKAFAWGAWPTKLIMAGTLVIFFVFVQRATRSFCAAFVCFFAMAGSYGCWIWGIQPNALGMALAVELWTLLLLAVWQKNRSLAVLALSSTAMSLCVYTHITLGYFSIGIYVFVMGMIVLQRRDAFFKETLVFNGVTALLAAGFCKLLIFNYGTTNLQVISSDMTAASTFEPFGTNLRNIHLFIKALSDNIVTGVMNVTNVWDPKGGWEAAVVALEISTLFALMISLFATFRETMRKLGRPLGWLLSLASLGVLSGFMLRNAASHYYVIATVPNLCLFLYLLFGETERIPAVEMTKRSILLTVFAAAAICYNGFSHLNVRRGDDIFANEYYQGAFDIQHRLESDVPKAYIFKTFEMPYVGDAVRTYYRPKFKRIVWTDADDAWKRLVVFKNNVSTLLSAHNDVFVGKEAYAALQSFIPREFESNPAGDGLWKVSLHRRQP